MVDQPLYIRAQSIQSYMSSKGLPFQVVKFAESTRTAVDAAQAIGCQVSQIVKSLIFRTKESNTPILVLVSGKNRVDEKLITNAVGESIAKADADFTREVTGFAIGGIPPVGHAQVIKTFIDKDLLELGELWAAAGTPHTVFSVQSKDLVSLTNGCVISVY